MNTEELVKNNCILLDHVDKSFDEKKVLDDVCLEIPYGSIYGLLGPSGCGKTTTVKIISGISTSTNGNTFVFGELMPTLPLMNKIGYMAQSDALYLSLTARENLEFLGSIYGIKKPSLQKRILEVSRIVDLEYELDKATVKYSGGMKRRLSLAAALLHEPKLLVLDEPTVGIDPMLRKSIWNELMKIAENGVTILVTTHVMDEAQKCTKLAMMREGRIIAKGTPAEIITDANEIAISNYNTNFNNEISNSQPAVELNTQHNEQLNLQSNERVNAVTTLEEAFIFYSQGGVSLEN